MEGVDLVGLCHDGVRRLDGAFRHGGFAGLGSLGEDGVCAPAYGRAVVGAMSLQWSRGNGGYRTGSRGLYVWIPGKGLGGSG